MLLFEYCVRIAIVIFSTVATLPTRTYRNARFIFIKWRHGSKVARNWYYKSLDSATLDTMILYKEVLYDILLCYRIMGVRREHYYWLNIWVRRSVIEHTPNTLRSQNKLLLLSSNIRERRIFIYREILKETGYTNRSIDYKYRNNLEHQNYVTIYESDNPVTDDIAKQLRLWLTNPSYIK